MTRASESSVTSRKASLVDRIGHARTLRVRLTLWYVLLLALILIGFSAVLYLLLDNGLDSQIDNDLRTAAEQVMGVVAQRDGQLVVQSTEGESELSPLGERGVLARVIGLDGEIIEGVGPFSTLPVPPGSLQVAQQGQPSFDQETSPGGVPVRLYTLPFEENGHTYGFIEVGQSLKSAQDTLQELLLVLAVVLPATLILASAGGWFLANRALSPIEKITQSARRISAEDLTQRLNLNLPNDEVGRLAGTFDTMLDRLEEAFDRQRRFTADASHELRTPLTIMKGNIGVVLNRPRSAADYQQVLADLEEEVDRLTRLVEDLLLLARADSSTPLLHTQSLDLHDVLSKVVEQVHPMSAAKGQTLELEAHRSIPIHGDPDKLIRLFFNLLDNAVKYTQCAGLISVKVLNPEQAAILVEVEDNGPGISTDALGHIFDRFYRADTSRSRSTGGAGLGLSIAQWIATAHGGYISVVSRPGHGSTFTVRLPIVQPS